MICKDCRWWTDADYSHICHPDDFDTGEEMEMPFQVCECKHPNITLFERNPDIRGISLCDGSNYHATMYTGEQFGCVNWEKK